MKTKTVFSCQNCGYQSPKWLGRCPDCSSWNSFVEEDYSAPGSKTKERTALYKDEPVLLKDVEIKDAQLKGAIKRANAITFGLAVFVLSFGIIGGTIFVKAFLGHETPKPTWTIRRRRTRSTTYCNGRPIGGTENQN